MTTDDATDAVHAFDPEHDAQPSGRHDPLQATATILKVRTSSRPSALAGAIAGVIRQVGQAELQAIGAGAINQAVKAIAIARSYLQEEGIDLWCVPSFIDLMIDGEERTALRLVIEVQQ
jgi:stage V sporulation protein S